MPENYMLLFRDEGVDWSQYSDEARGKALFQRFVDWAADLDKRGKLVAVDGLHDGGHTLRRKGASIVVDGPYAEGREAVLGYFIVAADSPEDALAIAAECPHVDIGGAVELRKVRPFPKP